MRPLTRFAFVLGAFGTVFLSFWIQGKPILEPLIGVSILLVIVYGFMMLVFAAGAQVHRDRVMPNSYQAMEQFPFPKSRTGFRAWNSVWRRGFVRDGPDKIFMECRLELTEAGLGVKGFTPIIVPRLGCRLLIPWDSVTRIEPTRLLFRHVGFGQKEAYELTIDGTPLQVVVRKSRSGALERCCSACSELEDHSEA